MKRLILTFAIAALVLPATALGKGPTSALLEGPGIGGITFKGYGESSGTSLGVLTEQTGFFPAVFSPEPNPMVAGRPKGELGPKYTITYTVPTGRLVDDTIRQDVYPYAEPSPVTYTAPGQKIFDRQTRGGWFLADPRLKQTLVSAGLPARAPASSPALTGSSGDSSFPLGLVGLLAAALLIATATTVVLRRRTRPAPAA